MYLDSNSRLCFMYVHNNVPLDYVMKTDGFMRMKPFLGCPLQVCLLDGECFADHTEEAINLLSEAGETPWVVGKIEEADSTDRSITLAGL